MSGVMFVCDVVLKGCAVYSVLHSFSHNGTRSCLAIVDNAQAHEGTAVFGSLYCVQGSTDAEAIAELKRLCFVVAARLAAEQPAIAESLRTLAQPGITSAPIRPCASPPTASS